MGESAEVDIVVGMYQPARATEIQATLRKRWRKWELKPLEMTAQEAADWHWPEPGVSARVREHRLLASSVARPAVRNWGGVDTIIVAQAWVAIEVYDPGDGYDLAKSLVRQVWRANGEMCLVRVRYWNYPDDELQDEATDGWADGLEELREAFWFDYHDEPLLAEEDKWGGRTRKP